jgi:TP901 family phage tail tape measure protein
VVHNLVAQLRFQADQGSLRQVQSQTASALAGVKGRIDFQLDPRAQSSVQRLSATVVELQSQMRSLSAAAAPAASAIGRMTSSLTSAAAAGSSASSGLRSVAASTRAVGAAAADATFSMADFGKATALAARRFVAFQVAAGSIGVVTRALREGVAGAVAFDSGLNRLQQVSGETASQVRSVGDEVMRLSTSLGASSSDLLDAAVTLKQAGLASRDVKTALEGIAQASLAPSFSSMRQVTEGAIAAFQQFGKSASNIKEQLGAINAVSADFAVEASDIVTTVQKLGGTASQAGASFNEMLAIFTSVRATTRESADSIATGLRTVLSRVQRSDTVESLKQLGIELRHTRAEAEAMGQTDMEGQFVGAYEAVRRLSEGLGKIRTTDPRFASAIEDLGGYRQVSRVIPLIQQFGEAQRALNVARLGSASLEAAAATRQDAIATKVAKTREEFQRFTNELVQTRGFKSMVDSVLTLASGLAQVLDVVKPLVPLMATLGTVKLAQGITQFGTGLYQGFTGSLGGARPVPRRFAIGGVVPGVGSGDTVPAQLEPGEFVIRKASAQRIGYDALYAMNAQRYNQGGQVKARSVVTADNVRAIIREYEQKTGIKFSALAGKVRLVDDGMFGDRAGVRGAFNRADRTVMLNRSTITTMAQLRETLAHEFGHATDQLLGGGRNYQSNSAGSDLAKYGRREAELQRRYDRADGTRYSKAYSDYYYSRKEGFARTFASHLAGDPEEGFRSRLNRRGFTSLLDDVARATNADYKPSLFQRLKVGASRLLRRFADGGKVDALLTPGEFVFSKEAAARLGPDALKRMNLYGDVPRFAAGGSVLRYATGGGAPDLNALIGRVLARLPQSNFEGVSRAGEYIARALAAGQLNPTAADLEARLNRLASLGFKAGQMADVRQRRAGTRRVDTGVLTATGASVLDSVAARDESIPLSREVRRGREALATRQARDVEVAVLGRLQAQGLSGATLEAAYVRETAGFTTSARVNAGPVPVFAPRPVAQSAESGVLLASAGGGRPPVVPPVATGPAPDDGRQGSQSTYRGAYLLARRAGLDAYRSRAQAVLALDAGGYGQQAVAAYGTLGSRTNERRAQQASIEAERAAGRNPGVFERPSYPLAIPYRGTTRPVQAGTFGFAPEQSYGPRPDVNGVARAADTQAMLARLGMLARNPTTGAFPLYNRTDISPTAAPGIYGFAPPQAAGDRIPLASTGVPRDTYAVDQTKRYRAESVGLARNGFVGLNTSGAADLADARGYAGVRALGGPNLVSNQTALATQQAAHAKLEQELTRAIDRQVRALTPAITATEARRKAEEQARLALEQNAAILRNSKGQVVGTAANAQQLQAAGLAPGGAGWFSGATVRQRAGSFFGNLGRSFTPAGGMAGTYGLMFGAPMLAEQIGPSQQRIQAAAVTGNTTGAMAQGAAGSTLQYAAMGAGVGMVFGPWGAAIGAAAGGLIGLATGLSQTSKEIRNAKVGQAVQNLGDMLTAAANNVRGGIGTVSPDSLRREMNALNSEAGKRTREVTNRSWWNPMRGQALSAMTSEEQAAVRTKENRAVFGGQAGAMVALLSREAENLARKNPRTRAADLGGRLGADPAAGQLVNAVAATRGVPVNQVLREFTESIRVAQRRVRVEENLRRGQVAAERSAGAMSRLADAVSNAANSVARFETSMTVLGSVFSGSGGTGRVTPVGTGFASLGAGTGAEFRRSAGVLGEALGADGSLFLRRSEAADQLSRALPSVLATLGNTPVGAAGLSGKAVRDLLHDQLLPGMDEAQRKAALKDNQPLDAIESAVSGILRVQEDAKESGGLARRLQDDAGRVAQEVAEAFAGPLKEMGLRMARDIEENANRFVDGLASARQMLNTVGESLDRAAELRLGAARTAADVTADRTGRSATDLLSLRDLQAPFAERQQRLTGLGADAENPAAIAARLRQVTGDIAAATSARDNAVGSRDRFSAAAGNLDRLVGVSNNLQSALRNLASASERAAGLQEKLNAATLNRDSRLGYAEKYAMSSPEEQARMQRGQQLIIGLDRGADELQRPGAQRTAARPPVAERLRADAAGQRADGRGPQAPAPRRPPRGDRRRPGGRAAGAPGPDCRRLPDDRAGAARAGGLPAGHLHAVHRRPEVPARTVFCPTEHEPRRRTAPLRAKLPGRGQRRPGRAASGTPPARRPGPHRGARPGGSKEPARRPGRRHGVLCGRRPVPLPGERAGRGARHPGRAAGRPEGHRGRAARRPVQRPEDREARRGPADPRVRPALARGPVRGDAGRDGADEAVRREPGGAADLVHDDARPAPEHAGLGGPQRDGAGPVGHARASDGRPVPRRSEPRSPGRGRPGPPGSERRRPVGRPLGADGDAQPRHARRAGQGHDRRDYPVPRPGAAGRGGAAAGDGERGGQRGAGGRGRAGRRAASGGRRVYAARDRHRAGNADPGRVRHQPGVDPGESPPPARNQRRAGRGAVPPGGRPNHP